MPRSNSVKDILSYVLLLIVFIITSGLVNQNYGLFITESPIIVLNNGSIKQDKLNLKKQFLASKIKKLNPNANSIIIAKLIVDIATVYKIDPFLIGAIVHVESNFNPVAASRIGAVGLMQVLPSTATYISRQKNISKMLYTPEFNIYCGSNYISFLKSKFNYDTEKMLMAYNWGPTKLNRTLREKRQPHPIVKAYSKKILNLSENWSKEFKKLI